MTGGVFSRRAVLLGVGAAGVTVLFLPALAAEPSVLLFEQLYKSIGVRGLQFSDTVRALAGKPVVMHGYMAPPLKAESRFFVLTREPMALCPFCQSDADWPVDIVVVFLDRATPMYDGGESVAVQGVLEVGSQTDPETGFVSQVRLVEAHVRRT